jgi:hypothetical protein
MITAPNGGKLPMIADGRSDIPDLLPGGLLIIGRRSGIPGVTAAGSDDQRRVAPRACHGIGQLGHLGRRDGPWAG